MKLYRNKKYIQKIQICVYLEGTRVSFPNYNYFKNYSCCFEYYYFFKLPNRIPLCRYAAMCLSIPLLINICVVPSF